LHIGQKGYSFTMYRLGGNAQKIWINKFGEPEYYLKDYWGEGADHMVWRLKVSEVLE